MAGTTRLEVATSAVTGFTTTYNDAGTAKIPASRTRQRDLWVGLRVEDFDARLRNRLSSISQNPQNPNRLLRLKNANVATTKIIKLAKVAWLAAYDLKWRTRCPTAYRPCCFVI